MICEQPIDRGQDEHYLDIWYGQKVGRTVDNGWQVDSVKWTVMATGRVNIGLHTLCQR